MRKKSLPFFAILLIAPLFVLVEGKEWRGITPLHSTRVDVERLFRPSKTKKQLSTYQTAEEAISVLYASGPPCGFDAGSEWRVPYDTVVSITVSPRNRVFFSELKLDLTNFEKFGGLHRPNIVTYLSKEQGERIEVFQDEVMSITYLAASSDSNLHCGQSAGTVKRIEMQNNSGKVSKGTPWKSGSKKRIRTKLGRFPKLAFDNLPANSFVLNFAGLVNGNVCGAGVSDPALFGIDVGGRQFR